MGRRLCYLYCNCPRSAFLESNFKAFYPTMKNCEWSFLSKNKCNFMRSVSKLTKLCIWVSCLHWMDQLNESHRESHLELAPLTNVLHERGPGVTLYKDGLGKPGLHWRWSEWFTILYMWMGFVVLVTANSNSFQCNDIYIYINGDIRLDPFMSERHWCLPLEVPLGHYEAPACFGLSYNRLIHSFWNLLCGRF